MMKEVGGEVSGQRKRIIAVINQCLTAKLAFPRDPTHPCFPTTRASTAPSSASSPVRPPQSPTGPSFPTFVPCSSNPGYRTPEMHSCSSNLRGNTRPWWRDITH